jgi:hypothetical protein
MKKPKKVTLAAKAKKAGLPAQIVYNRIHEGWTLKKALSVPVRKKAKPKPKDDQLWGTEARKKKVEPLGSRVKPATTPPKKAPSPLSQRTNIPLPIQKFEGKKTYMDSPRTVVVSLAVILVIVILVVVNA